MFSVQSDGTFSKTDGYFKKLLRSSEIRIVESYAEKGVAALSSATPIDSAVTATSWYYEVARENGQIRIDFKNSNVNKGVNIAIILQYGHGTGTGGWVEGRDYINPAIQPVFDELANQAWAEVSRL